MQDYAGNYNYYEDNDFNVSFNLINDQSTVYIAPNDTEAPVIKSITLAKTEVRVGDIIRVTAEIEDESSIYTKDIQFKCGVNDVYIGLTHVDGNIYEGEIHIGDYLISGEYNLYYWWMQDYAGNYNYYEDNGFNVSFTIIK